MWENQSYFEQKIFVCTVWKHCCQNLRPMPIATVLSFYSACKATCQRTQGTYQFALISTITLKLVSCHQILHILKDKTWNNFSEEMALDVAIKYIDNSKILLNTIWNWGTRSMKLIKRYDLLFYSSRNALHLHRVRFSTVSIFVLPKNEL